MLCAILHPVFRNRLLLGSTTCTLATILPFSCGFSILIGIISGILTRSKSTKAMIFSNGIYFVSMIIVIGSTIAVYKSIGSSSEESFQKDFLKVLETNSEKGMKTLHKFQQSSECCGVPLSEDITWNQTSTSPSNPWASWFYYTILNEEYIDETRRLFTLPWSCCSDRTLDCEHLAFERVSIKPSSKDLIIDELVEIEHRLRNSRKSEDGRQSVYDSSCETPAKVLLADVPFQLLIVGSIFAFLTLVAIGMDSLFIWKIYKTH